MSDLAKAIRQLKYKASQYVFPGGPTDSLLGFPVNLTASMPTPTAEAHVLIFGRFDCGYIICDRTPLTMSFDQITKPGFGW